ncbi:hypothetical protein HPB50_005741 [Hyalomma asiaticum]|uniref:Uncharacterized protein n=1 Tax=Hyalomma asiaticum TaxID=266040 RepID=A0ACB7SN06_HYAAI|nr:hypothetical protein HPB50_005741 [Hyalomma asiaticum]
MTGSAASKKELLSLSQAPSNFDEDAFQRELWQLRVSRIHAYPTTIFARGGLMPTVPSRNSITITGRNVSRTSLFEVGDSPFDSDDVRATPAPAATQTMSPEGPEHMEPAVRTPEPRLSSLEKDDAKTPEQ